MNNIYILVGKKTVPEDDLSKWGRWFKTANRNVNETWVGRRRVSTVFLGVDHRYFGKGEPLLFETMTFPDGDICERCSTWKEAEKQHERVVKMIKKASDE